MIKTIFIRQDDVRTNEVNGFEIGAVIVYPDKPRAMFNKCLVDIGFRGAKENLSVVEALNYYKSVIRYCKEPYLVIPDNNQRYSVYSDKLAKFIKYVRENKFTGDITWVLPIHGTDVTTLYNAVYWDVKDLGYNVMFGLPSHEATIAGKYDYFKLIDCSKNFEACININYHKMVLVRQVIPRAEFHIMGCTMAQFATYHKSKQFDGVISVDTMSYRLAPSNRDKENGKYMCTDNCWDWFIKWLDRALNREIIQPSPLLFL